MDSPVDQSNSFQQRDTLVIQEYLDQEETLLEEWEVDALARGIVPSNIAGAGVNLVALSDQRLLYRQSAGHLQALPRTQISEAEIETTTVADSSVLDLGKRAAAYGILASVTLALGFVLLNFPEQVDETISTTATEQILVTLPAVVGIVVYFLSGLSAGPKKLNITRAVLSLTIEGEDDQLHIVAPHETCQEIFRKAQNATSSD